MSYLFRRLHEAFGHSIDIVWVISIPPTYGPRGLLYTCSCGKEWVE